MRLAVLFTAGAAWWLGYPRECVGCGEADFGGPALDVRPGPVPGIPGAGAGDVGEDHRGDGGIAVQQPPGKPGHFPGVLVAGCPASCVAAVLAADVIVVDGQGHRWSPPLRSGADVRVRLGFRVRTDAWKSRAAPVPVACFQPLAGR